MKRDWQWRRVRDGLYMHRSGVQVERHDHPMSGHFALWVVVGQKGHWPTLREAKQWVERGATR